MGKAFEAVRTTRDIAHLFAFFGVDAQPRLVEAHRAAIAARFSVEAREIVRLCSHMRERERHQLCREALRLAYESAILRGAAEPTR